MHYGILFVFLFLFGCGEKGKPHSNHVKSELAPAMLGESYNRWQGVGLSSTCIDMNSVTPVTTPPINSETVFSYNTDYTTIKKILEASGSVSFSQGGVGIAAEMAYASEFQGSQYISSMTVTTHIGGGEVYIPIGANPRLNASGKWAKDQASISDKIDACGTHYISGYKLSALFTSTLMFVFANESDKLAFDAKISLAIAGVSAEAEVRALMEKATAAASVKIIMHQKGGTGMIMDALSDDIAACDINNRSSCLKAFEQVIKYASQIFPAQFQQPSLNRGYYVSHLQFAPLHEIYFNEPQIVSKELEVLREGFLDRLAAEKAAIHRAQVLLSSELVSAAKKIEMNKIRTVAQTRYDILQYYQERCYAKTNPLEKCRDATLEALNKTIGLTYSFSALSTSLLQFEEVCQSVKEWFILAQAEQQFDLNLETLLSIEDRQLFQELINSSLMPGQKKLLLSAHSILAGEHQYFTPNEKEYDCEALNALTFRQTALNLSGFRLRSLKFLSLVPYMEEINLADNLLGAALHDLVDNKYLKKVNLSNNLLYDLTTFQAQNMEELDLSENNLLDLSPLSHAKRLKILNLANNPTLDSLRGLVDMRALETLDVKRTSLAKAEVLDLIGRLTLDFPRLKKLCTNVTIEDFEKPAHLDVSCH